jgi:hypothetical protein
MTVSKPTKSAFFIALNCWCAMAWLTWQELSAAYDKIESVPCNFGEPFGLNDCMNLAYSALMLGITAAPFLMLWRDNFACPTNPQRLGLLK